MKKRIFVLWLVLSIWALARPPTLRAQFIIDAGLIPAADGFRSNVTILPEPSGRSQFWAFGVQTVTAPGQDGFAYKVLTGLPLSRKAEGRVTRIDLALGTALLSEGLAEDQLLEGLRPSDALLLQGGAGLLLGQEEEKALCAYFSLRGLVGAAASNEAVRLDLGWRLGSRQTGLAPGLAFGGDIVFLPVLAGFEVVHLLKLPAEGRSASFATAKLAYAPARSRVAAGVSWQHMGGEGAILLTLMTGLW